MRTVSLVSIALGLLSAVHAGPVPVNTGVGTSSSQTNTRDVYVLTVKFSGAETVDNEPGSSKGKGVETQAEGNPSDVPQELQQQILAVARDLVSVDRHNQISNEGRVAKWISPSSPINKDVRVKYIGKPILSKKKKNLGFKAWGTAIPFVTSDASPASIVIATEGGNAQRKPGDYMLALTKPVHVITVKFGFLEQDKRYSHPKDGADMTAEELPPNLRDQIRAAVRDVISKRRQRQCRSRPWQFTNWITPYEHFGSVDVMIQYTHPYLPNPKNPMDVNFQAWGISISPQTNEDIDAARFVLAVKDRSNDFDHAEAGQYMLMLTEPALAALQRT